MERETSIPDGPRRTKIIATIGPATQSPEVLEQLIRAGLDVVRINMSHADKNQAAEIVRNVRELSTKLDKRVGVLMDLQGPAIRTGDIQGSLDLEPGERIALTVRGEQSEEEQSVDVNYDQLVEDIKVGDSVQVDNGAIQLKVLEKRHNQLTCEVLTPGILGSRRHINLPGVRVNLPALTEKDMVDVETGIELGVDFIAMSFVREGEDVSRLRGILDYHKAQQKIVAKLEDQEGVRNLDEIIEHSDAIMVARGDLGIEVPFEELPIIQRKIVKTCITRGCPVIVATHMLESMIDSPMPTRAEVTDVANAVYEQASAIMLSGETSVGKYPVKCVEVMDRMARRIELSGGANYAAMAEMNSMGAKLVKAGSVLAEELEADALFVFTQTGQMARNMAWLRPLHSPLYAFTDNADLLNQLTLYWGVRPFLIEFNDNPMDNVENAIRVLKQHGLVRTGSKVVAVTEVTYQGKLVDTILTEEVH